MGHRTDGTLQLGTMTPAEEAALALTLEGTREQQTKPEKTQ